jgi:hypothetical protein
MKAKTFFLIVCAIALILAGCQKDDVFLSETADNAVSKSAVVKEVPIKMVVGYVVVTDFWPDFPVPGNQFPAMGLCYGAMSHLGKLQAEKSIWYTIGVAPDPVNPGILLWSQEGDWCAANGDLLHWTIVTNVEMGSDKVSGTAIFSGGTGRFENATGHLDLNGHVDPDDPSRFIVDSGVGMISNLGSSK